MYPQAVLADKLLVAVLAYVDVGFVVARLVPLQIVLANELLPARRTIELHPHPLVYVLDVGVRFQYDLFRVELALVPLVLVLCREVGVAVLANDHGRDVRDLCFPLDLVRMQDGLSGVAHRVGFLRSTHSHHAERRLVEVQVPDDEVRMKEQVQKIKLL